MEDARDLVPGVDYPRTFQEVDEWFRGDAACREYIRRLRWPGGFICPHCGWTGEPWVTSRGLLHCRGCQGQTSLTAGTIFQAPESRCACGSWRCGMSPTKRTASALWDCSVFSASAATRRPGPGCTSCAGRWSAADGTRSAERSRWTRPMSVAWKEAGAV